MQYVLSTFSVEQHFSAQFANPCKLNPPQRQTHKRERDKILRSVRKKITVWHQCTTGFTHDEAGISVGVMKMTNSRRVCC